MIRSKFHFDLNETRLAVIHDYPEFAGAGWEVEEVTLDPVLTVGGLEIPLRLMEKTAVARMRHEDGREAAVLLKVRSSMKIRQVSKGDKDVVARFAQLKTEGLTQVEAAKEMGVPHAKVMRLSKAIGVEIPTNHQVRYKTIKEAVADSDNLELVAQEHGTSMSTVNKFRKLLGIPTARRKSLQKVRRQVTELGAQGKKPREIAELLNISVGYVYGCRARDKMIKESSTTIEEAHERN